MLKITIIYQKTIFASFTNLYVHLKESTKLGCYNINDLEVRKLREENGIVLGSRPKRNYRFVFEANKPKNKSDNDKAHHLLRHIRNSFCHGLVTKKGRKFTLKDRNKVGNISMEADIRDDLLWSLLDKIIETQKA